MACYDSYRDQLACLYNGHAVWMPDPAKQYDRVRVGDVGFMDRGYFVRMFNSLSSVDDPIQVFGVPEGFISLNMGPFQNIRTQNFSNGEYCSNTVTALDQYDDNARRAAYVVKCYPAQSYSDTMGDISGPEEVEGTNTSFRCNRRSKGAFLSLPFNGRSEDAIRTKAFETYIRRHCDSWLTFALVNNFDVRLEDIILVTGCDLTSSWAMAAFTNPLDLEISLHVRPSNAGSATFVWSRTNQRHNNEPNQVPRAASVFLM